ncbi:unnamed protein product [Litomosoides sigmodontis]|uniref:Uncharacterized protein n=1 Tax=Litomosoides sigmodontis TaxID=42156 RepID=A0A3P6USD6_LITSI|nr:unnamed protein product [Litomosoides sigmodontis]
MFETSRNHFSNHIGDPKNGCCAMYSGFMVNIGMAGEANELMELLNCVRQFELDIKNENDEAENWRQCILINEQRIKKFAKVKQKLQHVLKTSKREVSQVREKVRKAKKDFDYCGKQIAEYTAAIEAAQCEHDELKRESEDFNARLSLAEENILDCILKMQIQMYKETQEEKKRIDVKLGLLGVDNGQHQDDLSTVEMHNDTSTPFPHREMFSQSS